MYPYVTRMVPVCTRVVFWSRSFTFSCVQTDTTLLTNNSQHCWMLHVASVCTPCCVLLNGVACCCAKFETGQTFSPVQTDATLLAYNSQHCWELLRPFARSLTLYTQCQIPRETVSFVFPRKHIFPPLAAVSLLG